MAVEQRWERCPRKPRTAGRPWGEEGPGGTLRQWLQEKPAPPTPGLQPGDLLTVTEHISIRTPKLRSCVTTILGH